MQKAAHAAALQPMPGLVADHAGGLLTNTSLQVWGAGRRAPHAAPMRLPCMRACVWGGCLLQEPSMGTAQWARLAGQSAAAFQVQPVDLACPTQPALPAALLLCFLALLPVLSASFTIPCHPLYPARPPLAHPYLSRPAPPPVCAACGSAVGGFPLAACQGAAVMGALPSGSTLPRQQGAHGQVRAAAARGHRGGRLRPTHHSYTFNSEPLLPAGALRPALLLLHMTACSFRALVRLYHCSPAAHDVCARAPPPPCRLERTAVTPLANQLANVEAFYASEAAAATRAVSA